MDPGALGTVWKGQLRVVGMGLQPMIATASLPPIRPSADTEAGMRRGGDRIRRRPSLTLNQSCIPYRFALQPVSPYGPGCSLAPPTAPYIRLT